MSGSTADALAVEFTGHRMPYGSPGGMQAIEVPSALGCFDLLRVVEQDREVGVGLSHKES
jgi:hypothetical protein